MNKEEFEARLKKAVDGCKTKVDVIAAISREFHDLNINYASPRKTKASAFFTDLFKDKKLVKEHLRYEEYANVTTSKIVGSTIKKITINVQKSSCPALTHLHCFTYQISVERKPNHYIKKTPPPYYGIH